MNDGKLNKQEESEIRSRMLSEKVAEILEEQEFSREEAFVAISNLMVVSFLDMASDMTDRQLRKFVKVYFRDLEKSVLEIRRLMEAKGEA